MILDKVLIQYGGRLASIGNLRTLEVKMTSDGLYEIHVRGKYHEDVIENIQKGNIIQIPERYIFNKPYSIGYYDFEVVTISHDKVNRDFEMKATSYVEPMKLIYDHEIPKPTEPEPPETITVYVTAATAVNVRDKPNGSILGVIPRGKQVTGIPHRSWLEIKYNGREAYIHRDYTSKTRPKERPSDFETEEVLEKRLSDRKAYLEKVRQQRDINISKADKYRKDKKKVPASLDKLIREQLETIVRVQAEISDITKMLDGPYYRDVPDLKDLEENKDDKAIENARALRRKRIDELNIQITNTKAFISELNRFKNMRKVGYVNAKKSLNVRDKPNGKIIGSLKRGAKVEGVLVYSWVEINYGKGKGYVHVDYIQNNPPKKPGEKKPQKEIDEDKTSETQQRLLTEYERKLKTYESEKAVLEDLVKQEKGPTHNLDDFRKAQKEWSPVTHKDMSVDSILSDVLVYLGSDWRIVNHYRRMPGMDYVASNKSFGEILDEMRGVVGFWIYFDIYMKDIHLFEPGKRPNAEYYHITLRNVDGLVRHEQEEAIYSHLLVKGKDGLTIKDVNDDNVWLFNEEGFNKLGYRKDSYWQDDRFVDPESLKAKGLQIIEETNLGQDIYTVQLNNVNNIDWGYRIGDQVHVSINDEGFVSHIAEITMNLLEPEKTKIQLGGTISKSLIGDRIRKSTSAIGFGRSAGKLGVDGWGQGKFYTQLGRDILQDEKDKFNERWDKRVEEVDRKLKQYNDDFDNMMANREEYVQHFIDKQIAENNLIIESDMKEIESKLDNYNSNWQTQFENAPKMTVDWMNENIGVLDGKTLMVDSINSNHIQAGTIDAVHIKSDAITSDKIHGNAIISRHISSGSINTGHIQAGAVTATELAAESIQAKHMTTGALESIKITSDMVVTALLEADMAKINEILAKTVIADQITAGKIQGNYIYMDLDTGHLVTRASRDETFKSDLYGGKFEIKEKSNRWAGYETTEVLSRHSSAGYEFLPDRRNLSGGMYFTHWKFDYFYDQTLSLSHGEDTVLALGYKTLDTVKPYVSFDHYDNIGRGNFPPINFYRSVHFDEHVELGQKKGWNFKIMHSSSTGQFILGAYDGETADLRILFKYAIGEILAGDAKGWNVLYKR